MQLNFSNIWRENIIEVSRQLPSKFEVTEMVGVYTILLLQTQVKVIPIKL